MKSTDDPKVVQCDKCGHFHSNYPEPKHTTIMGMLLAYEQVNPKPKNPTPQIPTGYFWNPSEIAVSEEDFAKLPSNVHHVIERNMVVLYPEYQAMEAVYNKYVEEYNGPGSVTFRFEHLMDALAKRFPDVHCQVMSDPSEPKYIAAIDKLLEKADFCEWEDTDEKAGVYRVVCYRTSCGRMASKSTDDGFCSRCGKLIKITS